MTDKIKVKARDGYAKLTLLKPYQCEKHDEYNLLIEAICRLAARDLVGSNKEDRFDAMDFFRSKWFRWLTNLDGEDIIQKLLA